MSHVVAFSQVCKLENVSRSYNHQHSLSARETFSTRPSFSWKYSNFVLASGLVKIYAMYCLHLHHVSDIVILYFSVFRSDMKHQVLIEIYTTLVITMNSRTIHLMIEQVS
jgi:hypothetical protein